MSRKGVPNFKPTQQDRELVETLAAFGIPHEHIAALVKNDGTPISVDTLTRHFSEELAQGLSKVTALLAGKVVAMARGLNSKATGADELRAAMFFLNTRAGWATRSGEPEVPDSEELDDVAVAARIASLIEKGLRAKAKRTEH